MLAKEVKLPIELHCHNDLGMVVACSVAGAKAAFGGWLEGLSSLQTMGIAVVAAGLKPGPSGTAGDGTTYPTMNSQACRAAVFGCLPLS